MADPGSPAQSGPIAAPAPTRERHGPGHALTEAEFWANDAAPAIGGRYGIPNGMLASAAAAPGAPDDVGSMLGQLDARRARGLALQLQRSMGNAGLRGMLAARAQGLPAANARTNPRNGATRPVLQREPPTTTVPPPPPASAGQLPLSPDELAKLEKDDREFKTLSATRGSVEVWLENPEMVSRGLKEKRVESFTVQSFLPRGSAPEQRRSWDAEGPALAFVIAMGGGQGGAVFKGETGYFAAIGSGAPSLKRDQVFQVRPTSGIVKVVSIEGFAWSPGSIYEPNASRGEASMDTSAKGMAGTATAADLARIAGIQRPEDKNNPDAAGARPTEIPEAQVRTFLRQYMVARAVEILDANAAHARKEQEEFRGAKPGEPAATTLPPSAKKKMDKAREIGVKFSKIIEMERTLEDTEAKVGRGQLTGGGSQMLVTVNGHKLKVETWKKRIAASRQILASGKATILSENPLIAQLVDPRIGREEWGMQVRALVGAVDPNGVKGWDHLTGTDNPFLRSELAKKSSPEGDLKARDDYVKKLDEVLKAVGEVKAKVLAGDERYLFSLPGLGQRVRGELKSIAGKNAKLSEQLEKIVGDLGMSAGDIAAAVVQVAGIVLQLAGFFFPPLLFIGAVMSFGATTYNMDKALEKLTVSQAAVTPDEAMVDPVEAQSAMIDHTIQLAMDALSVGMEVGAALEAMEAGRAKDLEKLAAKGEPHPAEPAPPKPGEPPKGVEPAADPHGGGTTAPASASAVDPAMTTKTGLAGPEALRKYTQGMSKVQEEWVAAKSAADRAMLLQGRARAAAADAGIPHDINVVPDPSVKGFKAKFDRTTMTVKVSPDILNNATADIASVGELVYHETRHAEQTWQMARMRALNNDAATIAKDMNIPLELAEKAVANKLVQGSEEFKAAERWYESMFGAGKKDRTELLKPGGLLDQAEARTAEAKAAYMKLKGTPGASAQELETAEEAWRKEWNVYAERDRQYRSLPEEQDAYLVGGKAKSQLDLTNPDKAPDTTPTPSVGPPSSGDAPTMPKPPVAPAPDTTPGSVAPGTQPPSAAPDTTPGSVPPSTQPPSRAPDTTPGSAPPSTQPPSHAPDTEPDPKTLRSPTMTGGS